MLGRLQKSELTGIHLERVLAEIVSGLLARARPRAIILFGSGATDSLTAASDLDLAVLFKSSEQAEEARALILSPGPLSTWPIDLVLVSVEEFKRKLLLGGVYAEIAKGRILFPERIDWSEL